MAGSLALHRGTLFVGTHAKTASVRAFDLGGRELRPAFEFRDARAGRSEVSGLCVDEHHALLVADRPADRVRRFSLFGREIGGSGNAAPRAAPALLPGIIHRPVDIEVHGSREDGWMAVASAGESRHGVQVFDPDFSYRSSCASQGEPARPFRDPVRLASRGARLYVAEAGPRCDQVFRDFTFLFAFRLTLSDGVALEPCAIAPIAPERVVVAFRAPESGLFLVDGTGRPLRRLAEHGDAEGQVLEPSDVVFDPADEETGPRVWVIDREGLRVQVFTLEGRCQGAFLLEPRTLHARKRRDARNKGGR